VPATYLAKLNAEQRRAVEHGGESFNQAPPLLIIAGAGSGKTRSPIALPI
jgi:DNA helicase-2/ATP-dependent DNA helicase PcrA